MQTKKSNTPLVLSVILNLFLIGGGIYFLFFNKQNKREDFQSQIVSLSSQINNNHESLKDINMNYSLMQDQYTLNIKEIEAIVKVIELSKQFGYLTFKEQEKRKMERIVKETYEWIERKSIFNINIEGMNEQLKILLTVFQTKPSYETVKDIQNTFADIVAMMLQRSLGQTQRFYKFTEDIKKSIQQVEKNLEIPAS